MTIVQQIIKDRVKKYGPVPESFTFGDGIDWRSPLAETYLYVELPFWLMVAPGEVKVQYRGIEFVVSILGPWREVFLGDFTDSRVTCLHHGPSGPTVYEPEGTAASLIKEKKLPVMERDCKTVLRLTAVAHQDAFTAAGPDQPPRVMVEKRAYWASLCEAHLPVINEIIQRYRLVTYDYFAYEVSAMDVPVWYLKQAEKGYRAVLVPYREWDAKPVTINDPPIPGEKPVIRQFEWASISDLESISAEDASAGEFDLLDARFLMERGDYTGAVRRTTTAIEALIEAKLKEELLKIYDEAEALKRLEASKNDVPGRIRQWRKLSGKLIPGGLFDEFEHTRSVRHAIVHRAKRLTYGDRGHAQKMVDTGRWLYNHIEGKPERAKLRDTNVLKSVGRVALTIRFPVAVENDALVLQPLNSSSGSGQRHPAV